MIDDSVRRYFEFYMVNLNGENKTLNGSLVPIYNAACMPLFYWLLKYSAELNKYIVLVRVICEKYRFEDRKYLNPLNRIQANFNILNQQNVFITAGNIHLFEESCSQTKHSYVYKSKACYNGTGF